MINYFSSKLHQSINQPVGYFFYAFQNEEYNVMSLIHYSVLKTCQQGKRMFRIYCIWNWIQLQIFPHKVGPLVDRTITGKQSSVLKLSKIGVSRFLPSRLPSKCGIGKIFLFQHQQGKPNLVCPFPPWRKMTILETEKKDWRLLPLYAWFFLVSLHLWSLVFLTIYFIFH